jgi:hypothetical protein
MVLGDRKLDILLKDTRTPETPIFRATQQKRSPAVRFAFAPRKEWVENVEQFTGARKLGSLPVHEYMPPEKFETRDGVGRDNCSLFLFSRLFSRL